MYLFRGGGGLFRSVSVGERSWRNEDFGLGGGQRGGQVANYHSDGHGNGELGRWDTPRGSLRSWMHARHGGLAVSCRGNKKAAFCNTRKLYMLDRHTENDINSNECKLQQVAHVPVAGALRLQCSHRGCLLSISAFARHYEAYSPASGRLCIALRPSSVCCSHRLCCTTLSTTLLDNYSQSISSRMSFAHLHASTYASWP